MRAGDPARGAQPLEKVCDMNKLVIRVAACVAATGAWTFAARSAGSAPAAEPPAVQSESPAYRPVTSDLMNSVVQPRHIKLWLAGQAGNWDYAEYERHNIGGALARISAAIPSYKGQATAAMVSAFATPQLAKLQSAIAAKDPAAFTRAYDGLTTGCNACHQASGHSMVVMQRPGSDSFPDQTFAPSAH